MSASENKDSLKLASTPFTLAISGALALILGTLIVSDQLEILTLYDKETKLPIGKISNVTEIPPSTNFTFFIEPLDWLYTKSKQSTTQNSSNTITTTESSTFVNDRVKGARYIGYFLMISGWTMFCVATLMEPNATISGAGNYAPKSNFMYKGIGCAMYAVAGILFTLLFTILAQMSNQYLYIGVCVLFIAAMVAGSFLFSISEGEEDYIDINVNRLTLTLSATMIMFISLILIKFDRRCCSASAYGHTFSMGTPLMCFSFMMLSIGISLE